MRSPSRWKRKKLKVFGNQALSHAFKIMFNHLNESKNFTQCVGTKKTMKQKPKRVDVWGEFTRKGTRSGGWNSPKGKKYRKTNYSV